MNVEGAMQINLPCFFSYWGETAIKDKNHSSNVKSALNLVFVDSDGQTQQTI